ncbi:hypothetical protein [Allosphingosinicella indica]|uniref:Uncharacterized protein n=1 Tax=Allosphingosinicella indica TaxID=941907 RepID=A0A1X7FZ51_9SPHN|nr:hypothetical protein [Allosphingosinicella indica]SMF61361.1 hypothetical protein SAMN06295910_0346 [Allosphingosinicella indica]
MRTAQPASGALPWRLLLWGSAALLLLLALVAMQFTPEVQWGAEDFLAAALLIGGAGALIELAIHRTRRGRMRVLLIAAVAAAFLLIWAELAVGIFR